MACVYGRLVVRLGIITVQQLFVEGSCSERPLAAKQVCLQHHTSMAQRVRQLLRLAAGALQCCVQQLCSL
jgi:hypothetical protein